MTGVERKLRADVTVRQTYEHSDGAQCKAASDPEKMISDVRLLHGILMDVLWLVRWWWNKTI